MSHSLPPILSPGMEPPRPMWCPSCAQAEAQCDRMAQRIRDLEAALAQDARDLHRLIREHGKDYEGGPHGDMTLPLTRSLHRLVLAAADNIKPE